MRAYKRSSVTGLKDILHASNTRNCIFYFAFAPLICSERNHVRLRRIQTSCVIRVNLTFVTFSSFLTTSLVLNRILHQCRGCHNFANFRVVMTFFVCELMCVFKYLWAIPHMCSWNWILHTVCWDLVFWLLHGCSDFLMCVLTVGYVFWLYRTCVWLWNVWSHFGICVLTV